MSVNILIFRLGIMRNHNVRLRPKICIEFDGLFWSWIFWRGWIYRRVNEIHVGSFLIDVTPIGSWRADAISSKGIVYRWYIWRFYKKGNI